jgi:hypothetical protein
MNPLIKNKRGRTQPRSAPATYAPITGSTAIRTQVGATSANQDVGVAPQSGVSPFGFVAPRPSASPLVLFLLDLVLSLLVLFLLNLDLVLLRLGVVGLCHLLAKGK